jgi:hypothetical protein
MGIKNIPIEFIKICTWEISECSLGKHQNIPGGHIIIGKIKISTWKT